MAMLALWWRDPERTGSCSRCLYTQRMLPNRLLLHRKVVFQCRVFSNSRNEHSKLNTNSRVALCKSKVCFPFKHLLKESEEGRRAKNPKPKVNLKPKPNPDPNPRKLRRIRRRRLLKDRRRSMKPSRKSRGKLIVLRACRRRKSWRGHCLTSLSPIWTMSL